MSNLATTQAGIVLKAELDMQISTAKAYPRNPDAYAFIAKATTLATLDQETAEACIYSLPRTDKSGQKIFIKGPSIRLAEILACCWGNIHYASRIIEENDNKKATAEAIAWDLENNVQVRMSVKKKTTTSAGKPYGDDMRVMAENAAAAIARRNAILSIIPRALINRVYESTVKFAIGDQTQFAKKVHATFKKFEKMGIAEELILSYYNRKSITEISSEDLEDMFGIGTAIKDGQLPIEKAFVEQKDEVPQSKIGNLSEMIEQENGQLAPGAKDYFGE